MLGYSLALRPSTTVPAVPFRVSPTKDTNTSAVLPVTVPAPESPEASVIT
jgi:hypothetical protein